MTVTNDMMMDMEPQERRAPRTVWPVAIGLGTVMPAGGFAGYNKAASESGDAAMTPTVAVALSAMWVVGLAIALVLYHRTVDDHERQAYHLGAVAGFYAFIFPCPVWWVLWRADLAPPVEAMPLFALSLVANMTFYFWFKFR